MAKALQTPQRKPSTGWPASAPNAAAGAQMRKKKYVHPSSAPPGWSAAMVRAHQMATHVVAIRQSRVLNLGRFIPPNNSRLRCRQGFAQPFNASGHSWSSNKRACGSGVAGRGERSKTSERCTDCVIASPHALQMQRAWRVVRVAGQLVRTTSAEAEQFWQIRFTEAVLLVGGKVGEPVVPLA
jgi:hypothetical protein